MAAIGVDLLWRLCNLLINRKKTQLEPTRDFLYNFLADIVIPRKRSYRSANSQARFYLATRREIMVSPQLTLSKFACWPDVREPMFSG